VFPQPTQVEVAEMERRQALKTDKTCATQPTTVVTAHRFNTKFAIDLVAACAGITWAGG
jgi:hypothetical protein